MGFIMSVAGNILYIKAEQCVEVKHRDVTLGDLLTMECSQKNVIYKLKTVKILKIPNEGKHRYVISVLKLIEAIHQEYPNLEIQNIGVTDLIVTYEGLQKKNRFWDGVKIALVTLTTFFGSAFAIVTFNNDSGVSELFSDIYSLFMGQPKQGFSILELSYSIGTILGILVFFNHFGKKKVAVDPTPIEVEMRLYENDIYTTVIAEYGRKEQELDVGKTNTAGGTGT